MHKHFFFFFFATVNPHLLAATWNVSDAFQVFCCSLLWLGFFFAFWIYLSSLHLPVQSTSSPWLVTALTSTCVTISVLSVAEKPQSTFSALFSQVHVDVQFHGKCRAGAGCLQMPISLLMETRESWNSPIGYKVNCWQFVFNCVRVLLCLNFFISVGNRILFADILKGMWSISSTEIVWVFFFWNLLLLELICSWDRALRIQSYFNL